MSILQKLFGITVRESANDGSDFPVNPETDYQIVFLGEDGLLHLKDSAGTVTDIGGGSSDLDAIITASSGQDIADALTGAASPAAGNVFATMADVGAPGGGAAYSQAIDYPTSFSGNDWHADTASTDTTAFSTKELLNSKVVHFRTLGASKDHSTYWPLATPRAGAFDFRFRFALGGTFWGAQEDTYWHILATDSGGTTIALARLAFIKAAEIASPARISPFAIMRVGSTSLSTAQANSEPVARPGEDVTLRVTRDGSNALGFSYSIGSPANLAMAPILQEADNVPYAPSSAGTVARIYVQSHTPGGPGTTAQTDFWLDYFKDAS